jgi:hypothetical protein
MSKLDDIFNDTLIQTLELRLEDDIPIMKMQIKDLMLEIVNELTFPGEVNANASARRHTNGIIDPKELKQRISEL